MEKVRHRAKCQVLTHTASTLNRAASTRLTVPAPLLSCRCCLCAARGRELRRQLGMQLPAGDTAALPRDAAGAPRQTSGCSRRMPGGELWSLLRESSRSRAGWSHPNGTRYLLPTREERRAPREQVLPPACRQSPFHRAGLSSRRARAGTPSPRAPLPSCVPPGTGSGVCAGLSILNPIAQHGKRRSRGGRAGAERAGRLHKGLI